MTLIQIENSIQHFIDGQPFTLEERKRTLLKIGFELAKRSDKLEKNNDYKSYKQLEKIFDLKDKFYEYLVSHPLDLKLVIENFIVKY